MAKNPMQKPYLHQPPLPDDAHDLVSGAGGLIGPQGKDCTQDIDNATDVHQRETKKKK